MSEFYNRMKTVSSKLIGKFGGTVALKRLSGGIPDPISGSWQTPPTTETLTTHGVRSSWTAQELENTLILATDIKIALTAEAEPLVGDVVTFGGEEIGRVQVIEPKKPASVGIAYVIAVRL